MANFVRNIFASLSAGNQPAALFDQNFSDVHDAIQNGLLVFVGTIAGTNTITGTTSVGPPTALTAGQWVFFVPGGNNTGAATFNRDGLGGRNILQAGAALIGGELATGVPVLMFYDGSAYNVVGITTSGVFTALTSITTPVLILNGVRLTSTPNFFSTQFFPTF